MSPLVTIILLVLFFLSGFAGLIYQILWIKTFSFILGNTVHTLSTVLAAYMAGLALGSYFIGRWAARNRHPLFLFAGLELGTGLVCFILHGIFQNYLKDLGAIGGIYDPSQLGAILLRFLVAFAVLLPPTFLMGGTLPALSKFLARQREIMGRKVGALYGMNTLGAACGSFVTGFFLIRILGLNATNGVAMAVNGLVAISAVGLGMLMPMKGKMADARNESSGATVLQRRTRLFVFLFLVSGFTSFSYEVIYSRLTSYLLGDRIFASATMVTAFILGIGLGSLLIARWIDRTGKEWLWFSVLQALIGLSASMSMIFFPQILKLAARFEAGLTFSGPWHVVMVRFLEAFLLMCLPAAAFGATFPCIVKYLSRGEGAVSKDVGTAYAFNTAGGVMGALFTGFILIPMAGAYNGLIGIAMVSLVLSGISLFVWTSGRTGRIRAGLAVGWSIMVIAVLLLSIFLKAYPWPREDKKLIFSEEDASALITVYEGPAGYYLYGGNSMLSFPIGRTTAESVQRFQAHLPLMLHPDPKDVLVIGLGFGVTSGSFAVYDAVRSVESVELFPGAVHAAPIFHAYNNDLMRQPKSMLFIGDGRYFLKHTPRTYDIIVSNVSQSDLPGSAGCYTREYFEMAKARLRPDGIFLVHLFGSGGKMLFKTLRDVYPFVEGFLGYRGTVFMAASQQPFRLDAEGIAGKIAANPGFRDDLERGLIQNHAELVKRHIFDRHYVERIYSDPAVPLLTDDHPVLEYSLESSGLDLFRSAFE